MTAAMHGVEQLLERALTGREDSEKRFEAAGFFFSIAVFVVIFICKFGLGERVLKKADTSQSMHMVCRAYSILSSTVSTWAWRCPSSEVRQSRRNKQPSHSRFPTRSRLGQCAVIGTLRDDDDEEMRMMKMIQ